MGARHDTEALLSWLMHVVAAGEALDTFTVLQAPKLGYRREGHGPLAPFLKLHFERTGKIDLFLLLLALVDSCGGRIVPKQCTPWLL